MNQDERFLKSMHIEPFAIPEMRAPQTEQGEDGETFEDELEAEVIGGSVILSRENFFNLMSANHRLGMAMQPLKQKVDRLSRTRSRGWMLAAIVAGGWAGDRLARWLL